VILDWVKIALAVLLLAVLQLSAMPQLTPSSATPDLLLILVVAVGMLRGVEAAVITGFAAGVLLDAMTMGTMGLSSLLYMGAGAGVALRLEPSEQALGPIGSPLPPRPALQFVYVVAATAAVQVGLALAHVLLGDSYPARYELSSVIVPTLIQTAVAALVLLPLLRRLLPYRPRIDVPAIAPA
jgi:cell shape-determining protein MreD